MRNMIVRPDEVRGVCPCGTPTIAGEDLCPRCNSIEESSFMLDRRADVEDDVDDDDEFVDEDDDDEDLIDDEDLDE